MEAHRDFAVGDSDVGRHVDEIAKDQARLGPFNTMSVPGPASGVPFGSGTTSFAVIA